MSVSQSIFGVWRHLRALYALTGHHARNAPKTSRYYYQEPLTPTRTFLEVFSAKQSSPMDSNTSFTCGLQTQYTWFRRIFPQNHVNNHCEWPNIVSEARIESLFVENGQKMTSVDQKVVMVMMWWFWFLIHTILYFVLRRVMVKVKNFWVSLHRPNDHKLLPMCSDYPWTSKTVT